MALGAAAAQLFPDGRVAFAVFLVRVILLQLQEVTDRLLAALPAVLQMQIDTYNCNDILSACHSVSIVFVDITKDEVLIYIYIYIVFLFILNLFRAACFEFLNIINLSNENVRMIEPKLLFVFYC